VPLPPLRTPLALWIAVLAVSPGAGAQVPLDPERDPELVARLNDAKRGEASVPCDLLTYAPHLSFDFRFQGGYSLFIPLKRYSGAEDSIRVVTRVTPQNPAGPPVYLTQSLDLPDVPRKNRAEIQLAGGYFVGEGKYALDLMMLDNEGRVCRKHWQAEAKRSGGNREISLQIAPGAVAPFSFAAWKAMFDQDRKFAPHPQRLTILFHVAPLFRRNMNLRNYDQEMLLGSLASLLEQIPSSEVKLVAFNLDQQKELFRQENFDGSGWDQLLEAMERLQLGTVSYDALAHRAGHVDLLNKLVDEELAGRSRSKAVIFLGPTARQNDKLALPPHREENAPQPLFFYFEYKPYWFHGPEFPDVVYHLTRSLAGQVFRIHSPAEFASAIKTVRANLDEKPAQGTE
jgi:hypothetical protein